jgi:hypothetical protein
MKAAAGFLLGVAITGAGAWWLIRHIDKAEIILSPYNFSMQGMVYASVEGAVTGPNLGNPNNYIKAECHAGSACNVLTFEEITSSAVWPQKQVSGVYLEEWPVVLWDSETLVAQSQPSPFGCSRVTLTLKKATEEALYTREPFKGERSDCGNHEMKTHQWRIGPSPSFAD